MKHLNIRVSGKVQGVFFRASTKEQADQIGIKGFVRNEPNGDVYIEIEGEDDQMKLFLQWCQRGPSHAYVENVTVEEADFKKFVSFEVRR